MGNFQPALTLAAVTTYWRNRSPRRGQRHRGGPGGVVGGHRQAFLPAGEPVWPFSSRPTQKTEPISGSPGGWLLSRGVCWRSSGSSFSRSPLADLPLGAEPVLFGRAALTPARLPIAVSELCDFLAVWIDRSREVGDRSVVARRNRGVGGRILSSRRLAWSGGSFPNGSRDSSECHRRSGGTGSGHFHRRYTRALSSHFDTFSSVVRGASRCCPSLTRDVRLGLRWSRFIHAFHLDRSIRRSPTGSAAQSPPPCPTTVRPTSVEQAGWSSPWRSSRLWGRPRATFGGTSRG